MQIAANPGPAEAQSASSEAPRSDPAGAAAPMRGEAKGDDARSAPLHAFADTPIDDERADSLAFGAYADALASLIDNPATGTPLTLAINAGWGAGKSTLARMVQQRLALKPAPGDSRPHVLCNFNAWMHDDAPSMAAAFASEVLRAANRERHWLRRLARPLPRALWSTWERLVLWGTLVASLTLLAMFAVARVRGLDQIVMLLSGEAAAATGRATAFGASSGVGGGLLLLLVSRVGKPLLSAAKSVASFLEDPSSAASLGNLREVRAQLGQILADARRGPRRFVVFVDDLERCLPPRAIDLLEVVNQLLDHPGVVVVIMADMSAVAACAEIKYKDLAERYVRGGGGDRPRPFAYGWLYLQKIVQLQFDLPPPSANRLRELLARLSESIGEIPGARPSPREVGAVGEVRTRWRGRLAQIDGLGWIELGACALSLGLSVEPVLQLIARPALEPLIELGALIGGLLLVLYACERGRARRFAGVRGFIDQRLRAADAGDAAAQVAARFPRLSGVARAALIKERELLALMNNRQLLRDAHAEVRDHLSPYPRDLKRFLNQVQVLTAVARARGAFGGSPELTVKHIARWVALKQRWPLTAEAVQRQPARLRALEEHAARGEALGPLLGELGGDDADAALLAEFLRSERALGELGPRLAFLTPATEPQAAPLESGPAPAARSRSQLA